MDAAPPLPPMRRLAQRIGAAASSQTAVVTFARLLHNGLGFALSLAILDRFGLPGVGLLTIASLAVVVQATLLAFGLPYVLAKSRLGEAQRNAVGLAAAAGGLVIALPIGVVLGAAFGHDRAELEVIALLSLGGPYFAQSALADSLLVLQGRTRRTVLSPLGGLLGLGLAWGFAGSFAAFAAVLAAGRFAGVWLIFAGMRFEWCGWPALRELLGQGARFLVPDTLALAADQMSVALVALLLPRAELGAFGLCRQLLTGADTPMWSSLVVSYPRLCQAPQEAPALQLRMARQGVGIGLALAALSVVLGLVVYRSDEVARWAPVLMLAVPFRYMAGTAEFALRAMGAVASVNWMTVARCALVALLPVGISLGGLGGAVGAVVAQGVVVAFVARRLMTGALAGLPAATPAVPGMSAAGAEVSR